MRLVHSLGLPYPPTLGRSIIAGVVIWIGVRCVHVAVILFGMISSGLPPGSATVTQVLEVSGAVRVIFIGVAALLVYLDAIRHHEILLQHNLGVSTAWLVVATLLAAGTADLVVHTVLQ